MLMSSSMVIHSLLFLKNILMLCSIKLIKIEEEWSNISQNAKNLISKMLKRNPKHRISAQQALKDSWIQNNVHGEPLKTSKEDNEELLKAFTSLDADGNGVLSREEILNGYSDIYEDKTTEEIEVIVDELMSNVDINNKGEINFTEFVVAAMSREKLLHSKHIDKAFKMFDEDGNGFIDLDELKVAMSGVKLSDDEWRALIVKYDTNFDGVVSIKIFF